MKIFPTWKQFTKWSLPGKFSYISGWLALISLIGFFPTSCQRRGNRNTQDSNQESRPYVEVEIISPILRPDGGGRTKLQYRLKNSENMAVYNIRKGHRIFNEKKECLKHYYDFTDQYLLDLAPGARSLIHLDNLEKLIVESNGLDNKYLKLQLIITYNKSKDEKSKLYYSLENFVLVPINCKEGYCNEFRIAKPSSRFGIMEKFIDECKEFK